MKKSFAISLIVWLAAASQIWLAPSENACTDLRFQQQHLSFFPIDKSEAIKAALDAGSIVLSCDEIPGPPIHLASSDSLRQF